MTKVNRQLVNKILSRVKKEASRIFARKMTDIELTYFPVHGYRGLMTRLVLDFGRIEYSEKIVGIKEWPSKKGGEFEKCWRSSKTTYRN